MTVLLSLAKAFLVGGLLCAVGQVLIDKTKLTPARILVLYVVAGVLLGAVGLYEPLLHWAEEGAAIPLTGFGNVLASGTRDAVDKDGLIGVLEGPLYAGAVGIMAAILCALAVSVVARPKEK
ncbi:MAG: SpoVA/SpoVAEb family sporulation membrane protein [Clostridia bacterium]|nr:SpoVA/SpoVAEb family sporulation membrane protein [Clostridia bacterium]